MNVESLSHAAPHGECNRMQDATKAHLQQGETETLSKFLTGLTHEAVWTPKTTATCHMKTDASHQLTSSKSNPVYYPLSAPHLQMPMSSQQSHTPLLHWVMLVLITVVCWTLTAGYAIMN